MVQIATRHSLPTIPRTVVDLELRLYEILKRHYFVKLKRFDATEAHDVVKHEMYHLSKALSKIQLVIDSPNEENVSRLRIEVAPDMVIYALECSIAFETDWWSPLLQKEQPPSEAMLSYLSNLPEFNVDTDLQTALPNILGTAIHAVGRLGEFCDRHEHGEEAAVNLGYEVVLPFLRVALLLARHLSFNLDQQFDRRLIDVSNRYFAKHSV
jgi:hypothetical protein